MGCFKLSIGLCNDTETLIRKFWWGHCGDSRKIHWLWWDELTKSKFVGGIGFRDLAMFNDSLLAKKTWRLLHNKNSLFYKVFKARFFPNCSIMEVKDSSSGSYAWWNILKGRDVIQKGAHWRIENGKNLKIWQHQWLNRKHPPLVCSPMIAPLEEATIDLLIDDSRTMVSLMGYLHWRKLI